MGVGEGPVGPRHYGLCPLGAESALRQTGGVRQHKVYPEEVVVSVKQMNSLTYWKVMRMRVGGQGDLVQHGTGHTGGLTLDTF